MSSCIDMYLPRKTKCDSHYWKPTYIYASPFCSPCIYAICLTYRLYIYMIHYTCDLHIYLILYTCDQRIYVIHHNCDLDICTKNSLHVCDLLHFCGCLSSRPYLPPLQNFSLLRPPILLGTSVDSFMPNPSCHHSL
jgi:hypothetical protein